MNVALDVEAVLAGTHEYFIDQYNQNYNTDYRLSDVTTWDWVRKEVDWEDFNSIVIEGWKNGSIPPKEDNLSEAVQQLRSTGDITVDIVTGRTGVESSMKQWLRNHGIKYNDFISTDKTKAVLKHTHYIDDKPSLVEKLPADNTQYLIKRPYNSEVRSHDQIVPVDTVLEAQMKIV